MLDTLSLLTDTPHVALVKMLNAVNSSNVDPALVTTTQVQQLDGLRSQVLFTSLTDDPTEYAGSTPFAFNRLSLADSFEGTEFLIHVPIPTTTSVLVAAVFTALGWQYDDQDFIEEAITASPYVLKAQTGSRRWMGFVEIPIVL